MFYAIVHKQLCKSFFYEFEIYLRHTYLAYSFSQLCDYVIFEFIIAARVTVVTTFGYNSP